MIKTGLSIALLTIFIDQFSKKWVIAFLEEGSVVLGAHLNFILVSNTGISFGMFRTENSWGPWVLSVISLVIVFFLFLWLRQSRSKLQNYGLGMLIGGAISNVIDRIFYGAVFDFIDLHAFGYHWPTFNLADTAVVCGVFVILDYKIA